MNIAIWILAGAALGWAAFTYFGYNENRGKMLSMVIGLMGGFLGGKYLAPVFLEVAKVPADFSAAALFFAVVVSAGFLAVGNFVSNRYGI